MKIATLAQSPVFGGRVKSVDDSKALAVKAVRQVVRLDDAVAVVADHMGAAKKGLAALEIEWDEGPNASLGTADVVRELERASQRAGAIALREGDVEAAMASAIKVEASYQVPFLAHAALEPMNCTVDLRQDSCEVWVGTQVLSRAHAAADRRVAAGEGEGAQSSVGRRLRATARNRWSRACGSDRQTRRRPGKRSSGPARKISSTTCTGPTSSTGYPPVSMRTGCRSPGAASRAPRSSRFFPPAFKNGLDPDTTDGAIDLSYALPNVRVEYVRVEPPGIPTAFWRSVGPSHNVFVVESFIDELAAAANQDPLEYRRALLDNAPRAKAVLDLAAEKAGWGQPLPQGRVAAYRSSPSSGPTWPRWPKSRLCRTAKFASGGSSARSIAGSWSIRTRSRPRSRATIFGITAALYGEITLNGGRVEQGNFDTYQLLRINEVPRSTLSRVPSPLADGRPVRYLGHRSCGRKRDLRGDRQALAQDADR